MCTTILRDPIRAQCIQTLSIHIYQGITGWSLVSLADALLHTQDVLSALQSLRKLRLREGGEPSWHHLSHMLSENAYRFPFRLLELELDPPPLTALHTFLESQDSIERYHVGSWGWLKHEAVLDMSQFFPRLRSLKGSLRRMDMKDLVRGRQLQSVEVYGSIGSPAFRAVEQARTFPDHPTASLGVVHKVRLTWTALLAREYSFISFLSTQFCISP